ncbi:hypothetical protein HAT86_05520 [Roseovarius gahaiensis]|uniref:Uncharacterized protein n=1 Tax=Roseovarius gahaiensis TaxID=2716691 RepID=A0A967BD95_9RHOB|nr:hypothetical protein [Roseovarius gahaiensis]NHQ73926.1 hypothetical protein [Roseovarius gahaiensis]
MSWVYQAQIMAPLLDGNWRHQFAMLPTPYVRSKGEVRIFLGFCDKNMIGRVGYVDVDPSNPSKIKDISTRPLLDIGRPGTFDDNGVVPISIINQDNKLHLYYIGFQLGVRVPYYMFCGLAISTDDGESFVRVTQVPILERNDEELFARCGCHVIREKNLWRMWYVGSIAEGWTLKGQKKVPLYTVRHVTSTDGITWQPEVGQPCITFESDDEHGFGRPFVRRTNDGYEMFLSVRTYSRGYYIARATSNDGLNWEREKNELEIVGISEAGWANENTSYAHTLTVGSDEFLFFNGNGCGKTGFGYAKWIDN